MQALLDNLGGLGRGRLIALGATGLGLVLALFLGFGAIFAPAFVPLYGDLSPASASRIVTALEQSGFDVELDRDGTVVRVPEADVARARMALADQGLPSEGLPGWELFDEASGLGMNTFMQKVNRLRALEGEIARSIRTMDGVDAARVHLVLPEREAFSRSRPEATASVIVRSRPGYGVTRRQALAIRALVSSAVPDMMASSVTVLSANGETILAEGGEGEGEATLQGRQATLEDRLVRNVSEILAARVGASNVRVEANVELTTERQVVRTESFDPDQQVVRSTESREQASEGSEARAGEVSVANGLPPELAGGGGGEGPRSQESRSESNEIVNYEIGNTLSETVREPGDVERLSLAVLVNGTYVPGPDGDPVYTERSDEELAQIEALVRSAIGFDEARGDSVSVVSMEFVDVALDAGSAAGASVGDILARNTMSILRGLMALVIVLATLFFVVRPALRRAFPALDTSTGPDAIEGADGTTAQLQQSQRPAVAGPDAGQGSAVATIAAGEIDYDDSEDDDLIALASVKGGVRRRRVQSVGDLVDAEPDESIKVLRHWLAQGA
ncbi:flagellar M-ring protein [Roseivivax marinus]|uniref:Flagellar M-ring protein n=1 Tax=Roseivivax marinus TaxID=1379903 RepID=W4HHK1_9RHOB|nr:flagellar basal-body MS-ring/collar protein FliF [Roseivivax marinus]ETW11455.1 flagellar M-ring protein [Roseivivax marinus]